MGWRALLSRLDVRLISTRQRTREKIGFVKFGILTASVESWRWLKKRWLLGIGEGGCGNQVDGIRGLITRKETLTDTLVHGAICRTGLVRKAGKVLLDEVFLEVLARVPGHDFLAQLRRKLMRSLFQAPRDRPLNRGELPRGACTE